MALNAPVTDEEWEWYWQRNGEAWRANALAKEPDFRTKYAGLILLLLERAAEEYRTHPDGGAGRSKPSGPGHTFWDFTRRGSRHGAEGILPGMLVGGVVAGVQALAGLGKDKAQSDAPKQSPELGYRAFQLWTLRKSGIRLPDKR